MNTRVPAHIDGASGNAVTHYMYVMAVRNEPGKTLHYKVGRSRRPTRRRLDYMTVSPFTILVAHVAFPTKALAEWAQNMVLSLFSADRLTCRAGHECLRASARTDVFFDWLRRVRCHRDLVKWAKLAEEMFRVSGRARNDNEPAQISMPWLEGAA